MAEADRPLSVSEVHQIVGRAGRFGLQEEGFVGVLREAEPSARPEPWKETCSRVPRAPRDFQGPVESVATSRPSPTGSSAGGWVRCCRYSTDQRRWTMPTSAVADLDAMVELAGQLDEQVVDLSLRDRFVHAQAPVDTRTPAQVSQFLDWAHA